MVQMNETIESINTMVKVDIDDKDRCKRYMGRVIKNVKVQESPAWLKSRIRAMGLNPINNIVDITNFVMFEYNQPMHAFDLDKLEGNITIRAAKENEEITTLDGIDRVLKNGELVIADDEKDKQKKACLLRDAAEYKPIRDALSHTARLTKLAKDKLNMTYENIKARIIVLLNRA